MKYLLISLLLTGCKDDTRTGEQLFKEEKQCIKIANYFHSEYEFVNENGDYLCLIGPLHQFKNHIVFYETELSIVNRFISIIENKK